MTFSGHQKWKEFIVAAPTKQTLQGVLRKNGVTVGRQWRGRRRGKGGTQLPVQARGQLGSWAAVFKAAGPIL